MVCNRIFPDMCLGILTTTVPALKLIGFNSSILKYMHVCRYNVTLTMDFVLSGSWWAYPLFMITATTYAMR